MASRLAPLIEGRYPPGIYRWPSRAHPGALARELAGVGWAGHVLPGDITDAVRLFEECAAAMAFPAWFGHTWEGLADCLADLSWLPAVGHVVLWERYGSLARADLKAWSRAYEVLGFAVAARVRYAAAPLYVLLRGTGPDRSPVDGAPVPVLPAVNAAAGWPPRRAR
jgi:Barstar (barnase inhibitor)